MDVTYKLQVLNKEGVSTGRFADFSCFEGVKVNDHLLFLNVKSYLANQRQGTHKSKSRSEISGSTRKLIRQKGSGGARRGDINSPLLRGGGRVFGPMPNDYNNKINKKEKLLAFCAAFKCFLENSSVFVVESFDLPVIKTKEFAALMPTLKMHPEEKNLVLIKDSNENLILSARNISSVNVKLVDTLNTYTILNADKIFLTEDCVKKICDKVKVCL